MAERSFDHHEWRRESLRAEFETVYDRSAGIALGLATRIVGNQRTAEEIVRESFTALWQYMGQHHPGQSEVFAWLMRQIRQRSIHHVRAHAGVSPDPKTGSGLDLPAGIAGPENEIRNRGGAEVRAALTRLPANQRQAIELAFFGGYSHGEIANQLGLHIGAVTTQLRLGLHALASSLPASSEQEES